MKNLTKYITATLIAVFTVTILSTTPTYAASSVDVYCDGNADQEKINLVWTNNTTINLHGDSNGECVFTDRFVPYQYGDSLFDNVTVQGNGVIIKPSPDFSEMGMIEDGCGSTNITFSDFTLKNENFGAPTFGFLLCAESVKLNNIKIDGYLGGILMESGNVDAEDLFITNAQSIPDTTETLAVAFNSYHLSPSDEYYTAQGTFNWVSGRSDAKYAIAIFGVLSAENNLTDITINGAVLREDDFGVLDEIGLVTNTPINHFVNCGFPVGSGWDICPGTDGGTGEPDGGDNGNEIEAPGTGVLQNEFNNITMILGGAMIVICGFAVMRKLVKQ